MLSPFVYEALPMRVLFGNGTVAKLAFEAERLGMKRVLVLSTPEQAAQAEDIATTLGPLSAGVFSQATMHTPSVMKRAIARRRRMLRMEEVPVNFQYIEIGSSSRDQPCA